MSAGVHEPRSENGSTNRHESSFGRLAPVDTYEFRSENGGIFLVQDALRNIGNNGLGGDGKYRIFHGVEYSTMILPLMLISIIYGEKWGSVTKNKRT
jgi:hypothetical protein